MINSKTLIGSLVAVVSVVALGAAQASASSAPIGGISCTAELDGHGSFPGLVGTKKLQVSYRSPFRRK